MNVTAPRWRYAPWWMPASPALGAFFAVALLLWAMTQFGSGFSQAFSRGEWAAFSRDVLMAMAAAAAAGIFGGFAALAAIGGQIGIRRHAYGVRSLRIALLTIVAVCPLWAIGEVVSVETHALWAYPGVADARVVPLIAAFLIAWPAGHLAGLGYGLAAQLDRDEHPFLGLLGACLNCLGLLLWYLSIIAYPPTPNLSI